MPLYIRVDALKRVALVKTDVGVSVPVLDSHYAVADEGYAGTVAREMLVCHLRIVLLRPDELMVKVVALTALQLTSGEQGPDQQPVERGNRVEIV